MHYYHLSLEECKFIRPNVYVHHCYDCDLCYLNLDHHCMWMGKCVGPNTLRLFNISLGGLIAMFIIVSLVPFLTVLCNCMLQINISNNSFKIMFALVAIEANILL